MHRFSYLRRQLNKHDNRRLDLKGFLVAPFRMHNSEGYAWYHSASRAMVIYSQPVNKRKEASLFHGHSRGRRHVLLTSWLEQIVRLDSLLELDTTSSGLILVSIIATRS